MKHQSFISLMSLSLFLLLASFIFSNLSAQTETTKEYYDKDYGISFRYSPEWMLQTKAVDDTLHDLSLFSPSVGLITFEREDSLLTPEDWFKENQNLYNATFIKQLAQLTIQGKPTLIIGQPNTCQTSPMMVAIVSQREFIYKISYYGIGTTVDPSEFISVLHTLSFNEQSKGTTDYQSISDLTIPESIEAVSCDTVMSENNVTSAVKARICAGAAMYIPTEGTLTLPWGCEGGICAKWYSPAYPHRGIDIASGKDPGVTPVYAPYSGTVVLWRDHGIKLHYDGAFTGISSYFTHMKNQETGKTTITVTNGQKVYAGITKLGYQGNWKDVWTHLHVSWWKTSVGGESTQMTLNPTQYLKAKNLTWKSGWIPSGPVTCITPPDVPPSPPPTDFFDEEFALSQTQADTAWWFPWYDHSEGRRDYIMIANPDTTTAIIDIYVAGVKKSSAISIAAGKEWHVRYEDLIGGPVKIVSTNGRKIIATKRTLWNEPVSTVLQEPIEYSFGSPFALDVGIGEAATTWWSPWYDGDGKKDWVMVVNPGPNYAQVELRIDGEKSDDSPYVIPAGEVWTPRYLNTVGGPLQVISLNNQPILVSQRVLWPDDRSFNELRGIPHSAASTGWYAPWYDATDDKKDVIHVVNPGNSNATINVYIGGVRKTTNAIVPAQGEYHISYPGEKAGPLAVVSTNNQKIIVTQRVLWRVAGSSSFDETASVPREQLDTKWWFPWYDNTSNHKNWILVGNPSNTSANIDIYIDGNKQNSAPIVIPSGGVWTVRYDNLIGGPVQIISTNNVKIVASQRVLWDGQAVFNEVMGIPQSLVNLPTASKPLKIDNVSVLATNSNLPSIASVQERHLELGIVAENKMGVFQDTLWSWAVYNNKGESVPSLSYKNAQRYIPTGEIGHLIRLPISPDLPSGKYTLTGTVSTSNGAVSDSLSIAFEINANDYFVYLPAVVR